MSSPQVLIIGAGPVGLTAALTLRKYGLSVRIIDKDPEYHIGARGNGIQPRTLEIFKTLGVVDDILENSIEPPLMRLHDGKTIVKTWAFAEKGTKTPSVPYPDPRVLSQETTEAILRSHLAEYGVTVELGTELATLDQDDDKVVAHLIKHAADGSTTKESIEAEWLIGSDGARGVTRKLLNISFLGETLEEQAFLVSDVTVEKLDRQHWHMYSHQHGGFLGVFPIGEAPLFSLIAAGTPEFIKPVAEGTDEDFHNMFNQIKKDDDIELKTVRWKSYFRPNIRLAGSFNVGRAFIAGDGAHVHSPMGGQGLNSGVQDSFNLAWKLALVIKNLAPRTLLETYGAERIPIIKEVLNISSKLHKAAMSDGLPKDENSKPSEGLMRGKTLHQLGLNYRWSDIVLDERVATKETEGGEATKLWNPYGKEGDAVQAGDRAPDAPALVPVDGKGGPTTILDILTPTAHTLLTFVPSTAKDLDAVTPVLEAVAKYNARTSSSEPIINSYIVLPAGHTLQAPAPRAFVDSEGHARDAYGIAEAQKIKDAPITVVIRPDSFVGAFVSGAEGVDKYFSKILL